jgi:putative membrane protein
MPDLAKRLLSEAEKQKIIAAVQSAEKRTSGEIVPMIVSSSYHYPMAAVRGAALVAFPLALGLTPLAGGYLWLGSQNMWIFVALLVLLFGCLHQLVAHSPGLKRLFISRAEIEEEVREAALVNFFSEGLHRTRDATGVLIFISLLEHKVWVLADQGINARVAADQWQTIVAGIVEGIKAGRAAEAICEGVAQVGEVLARHFPRKAEDSDELQNLIVDD